MLDSSYCKDCPLKTSVLTTSITKVHSVSFSILLHYDSLLINTRSPTHVTSNSQPPISLLFCLRVERFLETPEVCEGEQRCLRQRKIFHFHVFFQDLGLTVATFSRIV